MEDPKASEEGKAMEDLKLLVMQALSANGSLDVIRAQLRSTVFAAIQSKQTNHNAEAAKAIASPPGEAAAALFVDFARALGLQHSLDVFPSECQFAPGAAQPRLLKELGLAGEQPLIYELLKQVRSRKSEAAGYDDDFEESSQSLPPDASADSEALAGYDFVEQAAVKRRP